MGTPTLAQIREKLIELAHVWEDIERALAADVRHPLPGALRLAFRVEAVYYPGLFGSLGQTRYLVLFSALDASARAAADTVESSRATLEREVLRHAQLWAAGTVPGTMEIVRVEKVSPKTVARGIECNRPERRGPAEPSPSAPPPRSPSPAVGPRDDADLGLTPEVVDRLFRAESTIPDVEAAGLLADSVASMMVAVATGGPRIATKEAQYRRENDALRAVLQRLGISYGNPHQDLWGWYGYWRERLPTYQERRVYVSGLFEPVRKALSERTSGRQDVDPGVLGGPTGWDAIDGMLGKLRRRYREAKDAEDYKAVGLVCVSILTELGTVVFDPARDLPAGETEPGPDDAKRRLELFLRRVASGDRGENVRKLVIAAYGQANTAKHRRTATRADAGIAANAASLLAQMLRLLGEEDADQTGA